VPTIETRIENLRTQATPLAPLLARGAFGGVLMGLANLVPGISGGTMLLAAGVYPAFIGSIAELTTLRFRVRSLALLGVVAGAAALAIVLLAGLMKGLVLEHRWVMYSLFIGLTLGGLPIVLRLARPLTPAVWSGGAAGAAAMAALAWVQSSDPEALGIGSGAGPLFFAGVVGASAMVLPGISGGYMLLLLGQYIPVLSAIDSLRAALSERDLGALLEVGLSAILPLGLGVGIGILAVSNVLGWLLRRFEKPTLGVLAGLLLGAVLGLWPFQQTISTTPTAAGSEVATIESATPSVHVEVDVEDLPTELFRPTSGQVLGSFLLILCGVAITSGVARLGRSEAQDSA
jgi:putative membrane protein